MFTSVHSLAVGEPTLLASLPEHLQPTAAHYLAKLKQLLLAPLRALYRLGGPVPLKLLNVLVDVQQELTSVLTQAGHGQHKAPSGHLPVGPNNGDVGVLASPAAAST